MNDEAGSDLGEAAILEGHYCSRHLVLFAEGTVGGAAGEIMEFRRPSGPGVPPNAFRLVARPSLHSAGRTPGSPPCVCSVLRMAVRPQNIIVYHADGQSLIPVNDPPIERIPGLEPLLDSLRAAEHDGAREALGVSTAISVDLALQAALINIPHQADGSAASGTVISLGVLEVRGGVPLLFVRLGLEPLP